MLINEFYFDSIRYWAEEDRPREKMLLKGKNALSDVDLIAILIGSGTPGINAIELSRQIFSQCHNNLIELGKMSIPELKRIKGIGDAKAITIAAALELGRRRQLTDLQERPAIRSSKDAYDVIGPMLLDLRVEEFWILLLNKANEVIHRTQLSAGGVSGTVVDIRIVFKTAFDHLASGIIVLHNHPSGNLKPSQADIDLTQKLKKSGVILDVPILDHLIVSERGYFSFADEGML